MATKRTSNPVSGLSKAPNAGKHPAAPASAQQPYDVPLPGTETPEIAPAHEARRSFDEPLPPPIPLAQFNSKIDAELLDRFRRVVKTVRRPTEGGRSRDISIQTATSEAMMMWINAHDR